MNKKIISGMVALSMVASLGLYANAQKLGDVIDDEKIDIADAAAVINHINGGKALEGLEAKAADVNEDGKIDIEDAVAIIGHINGLKPLTDKEVTEEEDSNVPDDSSKPDDSNPDDSSKPDEDSSKPDDDSSKPDDSNPTEDEDSMGENTQGAIDEVLDGEFKITGEGKVDYGKYKANLTGTIEQKGDVTHVVVMLGGKEVEECYTVNGKTYVKDSVGDFEEGKSKFGKLATGEFNDIYKGHKDNLDYKGSVENGDAVTETFEFSFHDSYITGEDVEVTITITYDADGAPVKVVAVDKSGKTVFESTTVTFEGTVEEIVLPFEA